MNNCRIRQAVANITRASAEGAVFGVFQPLPLQARIPAVAASSYGIAKVFGADNQEAAQTALLNSIFALAGGRANAAKELNGKTIRVTGENGTAANVRLAVEVNGRVRLVELPQSFKADLQVKIAELKSAVKTKLGNAGQFLRDQVTVTDAEVREARKVIDAYRKQQAKGLIQPVSLYMPPIAVTPEVWKAYSILAKRAISEGATNFKDFSQRMISSKYGRDVKPHLDKLFAQEAGQNIVKVNQPDLQAYKTQEKPLRDGFQAISDFRTSNKLPEFDMRRDVTGQKTGTVAFARVKGDGRVEFGTNTTVGERYFGSKNEVLRKQAIKDIEMKLGKLQDAKYNDRNTEFLTHAEAESILKLAEKNGGKLPEEVEMFVDRPTCYACRGRIGEVGKGLSLLAELYGVKKLTIYDSYGTTYIVRPNQATEVIKLDEK